MPLFIIKLTVPAGGSASKEVSGISGTIDDAYAYFPLNAGGYLFCQFDIGMMHFPTLIEGAESEITADNMAVKLPVEKGYTIGAGEKVIIKGRNIDANNPHSVYLWLYVS
jgi:hypothetical protein